MLCNLILPPLPLYNAENIFVIEALYDEACKLKLKAMLKNIVNLHIGKQYLEQ